ncbi:MAG: hypothetical protein K2K39_01765 [Clostridia bacterium]|nr:hypothetical protein [Clostridia bacterium]
MKKLVKMSMIIPVVFIAGIVLAIVGSLIGNETLTLVGVCILTYGLPGVMFILVVVGLVLMITGRLSDKDKKSDVTFGSSEPEKAEPSAAKEEAEKIEDINSSYGYESNRKLAEYQMDSVSTAYRNSSSRERVLGWLFFGFLMTAIGLAIVFLFLNILLGFFICLGAFAGTIIISLIVKTVLEKTSKSQRVDIAKYKEESAVVKACVLSSMGSTGGANRHSTVRVNSVTYRVILVVDGKEFNAYSSDFYNEGEKISAWVRRDGKGVAKIIGRSKDDETAARQARIEELEKKLMERGERIEALEREFGEDEDK